MKVHPRHKRGIPIRPGPEAELVAAAAQWLSASIATRPIWMGLDIAIGSGSPDLTVVVFQQAFTERFRPHRLDADLLAYLRTQRSSHLDEILHRLSAVREAVVLQRLHRLTQCGVVHVLKNGKLALSPDWKARGMDVVTVEAKVTDWRHAVRQARRNQLFSTRSYLAMPEHTASRVLISTELQESNLGLLSVSSHGDVSCLKPSGSLTPQVWTYYYTAVLSAVRYPKGQDHAV